jgi:hypothetical protein
MSLIPDNAPSSPEQSIAATPTPPRRTHTWQSRLLGICMAIFTFEIGLFLVVFPWMDDAWSINYIQKLIPTLRNVWEDPYFRGALTGLGLVNIYISFLEMIRLFRRA